MPHQLHETSDASLPPNIGLQGYSPVSYFEGQAEKGVVAFQTDYGGRVFYFTSAEQVSAFRDSPESYMPRYGEYCPYSLALGRRGQVTHACLSWRRIFGGYCGCGRAMPSLGQHPVRSWMASLSRLGITGSLG